MINILVDKLPTEYKGLKINTNFRPFILFELLMQDNTINESEKIFIALNIFFEEEIKDIKKAIEDVEKEFAGNGRVLIRPSGTEPLVRVMIEGEDQEYITKRAKEIVNLIEKKLA